MIWWTIPASVVSTTGVTEIVGSSSSSSSFDASPVQYTYPDSTAGPFVQTDQASGSASSSSTHISRTSADGTGATTYFSQSVSASATYSEAFTADLTPAAQSNTNNSYTGATTGSSTSSSSTSSSTSGETTTVFTAGVQTSTTETALSGYAVATTETRITNVWTTQAIGGDPSFSFVLTETEYTRSIEEWTERTITYDETTDLEETTASPLLRATVVQAANRHADAEIVYALTGATTHSASFDAATNGALSGTRLTLEPIVVTAQQAPVNAAQPTSYNESSITTSLVTYVGTTTQQATETTANYASFPPVTGTRTRSSVGTTNTTHGSVTLASIVNITHGGTRRSTTFSDSRQYVTTVQRQIATQTFATTILATSFFTQQTTIPAAPSASGQTTATATFNTGYNAAGAVANSASTTFSSSSVEGNVILTTMQADTFNNFNVVGQTKYGTIGAVIGNNKGGWITANSTSESANFAFSDIYALDGQRRATTMFPVTGQYETINRTGITWTTTTAGEEGSVSTTVSATFGVAGQTQTTTFSRDLSIIGGNAGPQETFIRTAAPGVYRNRANGETTFFLGAASVVSAEQSAPASFFTQIKAAKAQTATNAVGAFWAEPRNSTALPPNMPPDAPA
jgi:hypothetical protein